MSPQFTWWETKPHPGVNPLIPIPKALEAGILTGLEWVWHVLVPVTLAGGKEPH